jgi:ATP-dependent Clp protease ATP-binding subunit ClpX
MEGIELQFEEAVLDFIVNKAVEFKLGARGLRSICEAIMLDLMYELPQQKGKKEYTVTLDYAMAKINKSNLGKLKAA